MAKTLVATVPLVYLKSLTKICERVESMLEHVEGGDTWCIARDALEEAIAEHDHLFEQTYGINPNASDEKFDIQFVKGH